MAKEEKRVASEDETQDKVTRKVTARKGKTKKTLKKTSKKTTTKSKKTATKTVTLKIGSLSLALVSLTLILSLWGTMSLLKINGNLDERNSAYDNILQYMGVVNGRLDELKELAIPAKITIVSIVDPLCSDCSNISSFIDSVKKGHVNVTSEKTLEFSSSEAYSLIREYKIDLIPTVIIFSNEFDKTSLLKQWEKLGTVEDDGSLVLRTINPPYRSMSQGRILGLVTITLLKDPSCTNCVDMAPVITKIKASGVVIVNETEIESTSEEGKSLIAKYNITKVPSIIHSSDLGEYSNVKASWGSLGSVEADGSYVLRAIDHPYMDLVENKIVGLVSMVNIVDSSCTECYNVSVHQGIMSSFGLRLTGVITYDVATSEGKALVEKYNISLVPTIILIGEPGVYLNLKSAWPQVGSVESDGAYVFRKLNVLRAAKYRNLSSGQVIG